MSYQKIVHIEDVINSVVANNKISNRKGILRAYEYAKEKHGSVKRASGEDYINHPIRVAKFIAEWGFGSDIVIAALLHDVVEDCDTSIEEIEELFGNGVSSMVNTVTKIDKHIKECEGLTKEEIHALSDAKLQQYMSDKALYIKIADRLDNLNTIDIFEKSKQLKKTQHTHEILIPMVIKVEAYKLLDDLEELCFKIEHEAEYNKIMSYIDDYKASNIRSCNKTILLLENAFVHSKKLADDSSSDAFPSELEPYGRFISGFFSNERSCVSIFRQIVKNSKNIKKDFNTFLNKRNLAIYDLTLVFDDVINNADDGMTMHDIFYKYYEEYLITKNICILDYNCTTQKNGNYFLLCDDLGNLYRLFIRTENSYLHYMLGNIVDSDDSISFDDVNDVEPRDTYKPKITVFKRNGDKCTIDAGATALDFAFLLHSDLGLHFDYAIINEGRSQMGAHYILNEGDRIEVFTNAEITPKIQWFRYAKTSRAVKKLVDYLA